MLNISNIEAAAMPSAVLNRAELGAALAIVCNTIAKRSNVPVLSCARIVGAGAEATIVGTDCELEISVTIPAAIDSRFDLCLDAHKLADLIKKAPAGEMVALSQPEFPIVNLRDGSEHTGQADVPADFERIKFQLPGLAGSHWPSISAEPIVNTFRMTGAALRDALVAVEGAVSDEETRYYLNGIYAHVRHDGTLAFVATDGHRLYKQELAAPDGAAGMPDVIIHRETVATLLKLLKGKACPAEVEISVSAGRLGFSFGAVRIHAKTIDGTFPDYDRVIPRHNENVATAAADTLAEAVKGVSCISKEARAIRFAFGEDSVGLTMRTPDSGSSHMDAPLQSYRGAAMEIGFSSRLFADMLAVACPKGSDPIRIALSDPTAPAAFTCEREGWVGVLMPMRV